MAVQLPLRHPAVVSVPLGVRTAEEVAENARRCATPVPEDLWAELEAMNAP